MSGLHSEIPPRWVAAARCAFALCFGLLMAWGMYCMLDFSRAMTVNATRHTMDPMSRRVVAAGLAVCAVVSLIRGLWHLQALRHK